MNQHIRNSTANCCPRYTKHWQNFIRRKTIKPQSKLEKRDGRKTFQIRSINGQTTYKKVLYHLSSGKYKSNNEASAKTSKTVIHQKEKNQIVCKCHN